MRHSYRVFGMILLMVATAGASEETLVVAGLAQPVEVLRDRWGVSHIYAQTEHDLFFAQGFTAAGDRLFQLELWRRQATGTLAEIQGARALKGDIGARLLKYRGNLTSELNHYHPRGSAIIGAFVEGINAYVELVNQKPDLLPLPFRILGLEPGKWTPEIVVSRHNGLYRNVTLEVAHSQLVRSVGSERAEELLNLRPGRPSLNPDPAIDLALIRDDLLELYTASRGTVVFRPEDVQPPYRRAVASNSDGSRGTGARESLVHAEQIEPDPWSEGSNNWVVSGDRSFSRSAIMANDPHRPLLLPSLRYWVHLVGPGWNVIGGGEPALPGVSIGHNERGAWGLTIVHIDQEDLYVYETNKTNPSEYRYRDRWEPMRVVRETIAVKGQEPAAVELKYTRHGPVISEDPEHHRAFAMKAGWLEEGTAPYLASLRIDQASSWDEFREACRFFRMPSENMVWADVENRIGWQAVGLAPVRKNWNGLLPVPGDGRYEWGDFIPILDLPHLADPGRGWLATANQDNLPRGYPFTLGLQWNDPYRFSRLQEVLGSGRRFTLTDMEQLQQDELALPARSLMPLLRALHPATERSRSAQALLSNWDLVLDKNSVPASIYVTWERILKTSVWERSVPQEARSALPYRQFSTEKFVQWLSSPDGRFGADPIAERDAMATRALDQAVAELERRLGPDMSTWLYGQNKMKHVWLHHPLSDAVSPELQARLDLGPLPRGGYSNTVNNTSDNYNQASGASFRVIAEADDWDRSVATNTPGQSDNPDSPHYRDLFEPWANGSYFPIFYSRSKVESVTEERSLLRPN
jgi:penicillin G amidase